MTDIQKIIQRDAFYTSQALYGVKLPKYSRCRRNRGGPSWPSWHDFCQFSTISNKMELAEKLSNKNFHFYCCKKCKFMFEILSQSSILLQIVENLHTKCQGYKKRWPVFQV